jgi:hypothetical protein
VEVETRRMVTLLAPQGMKHDLPSVSRLKKITQIFLYFSFVKIFSLQVMDHFYSLPAALTATPSPLVALIGLDSNDRHSHLWRAFSAAAIVGHGHVTASAQQGKLKNKLTA